MKNVIIEKKIWHDIFKLMKGKRDHNNFIFLNDFLQGDQLTGKLLLNLSNTFFILI